MPDFLNPSRRERKKLRNRIRAASEAALPSKKRLLKEEVALSPFAIDDGEKRYTIGHQYYRDDLCTIKSMRIAYLRKVFECYKHMSKCITEPELFNLPMDIKRVKANNHYRKYISKITPDTELNEFDAGEHRGFFFLDRSEKIVQMIAVDTHPEDKKQTK